jgi:HPt (histidine-containing phosphotransfer) domain-containing protein
VEMRERLLATFQESLPQCVSEIAEAMERGDRAEVRRVAHKLKGSSATLGATRLGAACLALERTRDDDPVPGGAEIERLRELAEEARGALQVQLL